MRAAERQSATPAELTTASVPHVEIVLPPESSAPRLPVVVPSARNAPTQALVPFDLWGQPAWANFDVVGESYYGAGIRAAIGSDHVHEGAEHSRLAELVPEPTNPHDRNAVRVHIGVHHVGHLPREEAVRYAPVISALRAGGHAAMLRARVWAKTETEWNERKQRFVLTKDLYASVQLCLAEPHLIVPANLPPSAAHVLLPQGNSIQVSGEEHHLAALAAFVHHAGEQWVYATLHELTEQLTRTTRTVVEVRIDGERVGQLTPKMSGDMLAAVRFLHEREVLTAVRAIVKGNRAAAQVSLHAARAHQLDDAWFDQVSHSFA